jgi:hypothetical protein
MHQDIGYHIVLHANSGRSGDVFLHDKVSEGVRDVNVHFKSVVWPGAFAQFECKLGEPLDMVVWSP